MVSRKQPGDALLSEEVTSGADLSPPEPKKRVKSRTSYKATKLPYSLSQLILQAFENCSAGKGLSLAALKKHLSEVGYNVHRHNSRIKKELNNLVSHGLLTRLSGTSGASGSFRFNRLAKKKGKSELEKKKKAVAEKSPVRKKEPQKKTQKKQPPVNKPKQLQRQSAANSAKKNQLNNHPNRDVPAKKGKRRK